MLTRAIPIRLRLIRAFGLFAGGLVLLIWLVSLIYFFWSERDELIQTTQTQTAIVATQSSAAVIFDDLAALRENLSSLRHIRDIRWATIIDSSDAAKANANAPRQLISYGLPPADLSILLKKLDEHDNTLMQPTELTIRYPIVHNGVPRAQLLVNVDLHGKVDELILIIVASLVLNLLFLVAVARFFDRIVQTVATPIGELAELADKVSTEGALDSRVESEYPDEVGQLGRAINRMLDTIVSREHQLSQSQADLRALNNRMREVRESERTRISHEIHDELGQQMTAIKYELAKLENRKISVHLEAMVDVVIKKVRTISWELRPSVLDTLGLAEAIEWMGQDFQQRMGMRCGVHIT